MYLSERITVCHHRGDKKLKYCSRLGSIKSFLASVQTVVANHLFELKVLRTPNHARKTYAQPAPGGRITSHRPAAILKSPRSASARESSAPDGIFIIRRSVRFDCLFVGVCATITDSSRPPSQIRITSQSASEIVHNATMMIHRIIESCEAPLLNA